MYKTTLKALQGSIEKWQAIVDGYGEDHGPDNCPLCVKYYDNERTRCPVKLSTGQTYCDGSPYENWDEEQKKMNRFYPWIANTPELRRIAKAELKFLISLLPKEQSI